MLFKVLCFCIAVGVQSTYIHSGSSTSSREEDGHGNYAFNYDILDPLGASNGRYEEGDAFGNKKGYYTITDIDGRARRVDYIADSHGFRAVVQTNEPGTASSFPAGVVVSSPHKIPSPVVPVTRVKKVIHGAPVVPVVPIARVTKTVHPAPVAHVVPAVPVSPVAAISHVSKGAVPATHISRVASVSHVPKAVHEVPVYRPQTFRSLQAAHAARYLPTIHGTSFAVKSLHSSDPLHASDVPVDTVYHAPAARIPSHYLNDVHPEVINGASFYHPPLYNHVDKAAYSRPYAFRSHLL